MIEVLIAVLILAIGLLGVAALQMASMGSGQESYFRTQATALAEDYAARIKAGRANIVKQRADDGSLIWDAEDGGPLVATQTYLDQFVGATITEDGATDCMAQACSNEDMAASDRWEVSDQASRLLPDGSLHVVRNGLRLSIAVAWTATEARADTGEQAPRVNPACGDFAGIAANKDCVVVEAIP
jgi:type IV pilus assembly protein PilV